MELKAYLDIVWRQRGTVVATMIGVLLVAIVGSLLLKPTYTAISQLRLATAKGGGVSFVNFDVEYTDRLMLTFAKLSTSSTLQNEIVREFNLIDPPVVKAEVIPFTELLTVQAQHHDPVVAAGIANRMAQMLIEANEVNALDNASEVGLLLSRRLDELEAKLSGLNDQYEALLLTQSETDGVVVEVRQALQVEQETYGALLREYELGRIRNSLQTSQLTIVDVAGVPEKPSSPNLTLNTAIGGLLGLMGGLGLAFVVEGLNTHVRDTAQLAEITQLQTLTTIPAMVEQLDVTNGHLPQVEAFRRLVTTLFASAGQPPKTVLVTSVEPQEGKTTVVSNLATTLSAAGYRVLAIDANLRAPNLHRVLGVPNRTGLSDILLHDASIAEAIHPTLLTGLYLLSAGSRSTARGFYMARARELLAELAAHYDVLLIDTPAMLQYSDAIALSPYVDNVLLVVDGKQSRHETMIAATEQFRNAGIEPTGLVINHIS